MPSTLPDPYPRRSIAHHTVVRHPLRLWLPVLASMVVPVTPVIAQDPPPAGRAPTQARIAAPADKTTLHLRVAWYATSDTLAPGRPVSLRLEITPAPGMRVYAPGQLGYIPVALTLAPETAVKTGEVRLPEPVQHVFPPTGEKSLVFEKPFTLELPVTLAGRPKQGPLTIEGTLEYQACDDTVCYRPVRIPVSWTFTVKGTQPPARKPMSRG